MAKEFIPPAARRQSLKRQMPCGVSSVPRKTADLYVALMEALKPALSQFVSSEHRMLVDEITQIGLIESCLPKITKIRGAWDSAKLVSAGRLRE